jgi:hypothetical protein
MTHYTGAQGVAFTFQQTCFGKRHQLNSTSIILTPAERSHNYTERGKPGIRNRKSEIKNRKLRAI